MARLGLSFEAERAIDALGIDTLRDAKIDAVLRVRNYIPHTVAQQHAGRPDMLAYTYYGDVNMWWVIMTYNALVHRDEIYAGLVLRVPQREDVMHALHTLPTIRSGTSTGVSI